MTSESQEYEAYQIDYAAAELMEAKALLRYWLDSKGMTKEEIDHLENETARLLGGPS
jgi:hypothetical protein